MAERLNLVATDVRRRTLVVGDRQVPLFAGRRRPGPPGPHRPPLTVGISRAPARGSGRCR
jgi:hypothetical protein